MKSLFRAGLAAAGFVVWILLVSWMTTPVRAHEFFTEQYNPKTGQNCCNGKDCQVIGSDDWWQSGPVAHVMWIDGKVYSIPADEMLPTDDPEGRPAACVYDDKLRCLFIPLGY